MARTELSLLTSVRTGLVLAFTSAIADGHAFQNERENILLVVKNDSGGAVTVSIDTNNVDGLATPDQGGSVGAGTIEVFGPFGKGLYNQDDSAGDTGLTEAVFVDTSVQASISYAALKVGAKN